MRAIINIGKITEAAAMGNPAMHNATAAANDALSVERWLRYDDSGVTTETTSR